MECLSGRACYVKNVCATLDGERAGIIAGRGCGIDDDAENNVGVSIAGQKNAGDVGKENICVRREIIGRRAGEGDLNVVEEIGRQAGVGQCAGEVNFAGSDARLRRRREAERQILRVRGGQQKRQNRRQQELF